MWSLLNTKHINNFFFFWNAHSRGSQRWTFLLPTTRDTAFQDYPQEMRWTAATIKTKIEGFS